MQGGTHPEQNTQAANDAKRQHEQFSNIGGHLSHLLLLRLHAHKHTHAYSHIYGFSVVTGFHVYASSCMTQEHTDEPCVTTSI